MPPRSQALVKPTQVLSVVRELRGDDRKVQPLLLTGDPGLAGLLRQELTRGGDESAARLQGSAADASAVVVVLVATANQADVELLREAEREGTPAVAVVVEHGDATVPDPPYVLPGRVVRVPTGSGFPLDEIAGVLAPALDDDAPSLAAKLPALRDAVVRDLVQRHARRNGLLGVTAPSRATMPLLTLDQIRLVLGLAKLHGRPPGRERIPEVLAVVATGLALRTAARVLATPVRPARRLVHGAFAFAGTMAIGEAAKRYYRAK
jgi:hypothetical protein